MIKKVLFSILLVLASNQLLAVQFVPYGGHVVVQEIKKSSAGGIFIPDVSGVKTGIVVKKGDGVSPELIEGEIVFYGKHSGSDITVEGEEHLVLDESEILGVLGE